MDLAFWDSSSLVPLCMRQKVTPIAQALAEKHRMVVAWFAPVEVRGAIARLLRTAEITPIQQVQALVRLEVLRGDWREVAPNAAVREKAEDFVERFPLRAADALQLASAWNWCLGHPRERPFISGDRPLLDIAGQLGFSVIQA
jgi:predicted nucleic acid-binding protein